MHTPSNPEHRKLPYQVLVRIVPDINSSPNAHEVAQNWFEKLLQQGMNMLPCSPVFSKLSNNSGTIYYAQIKCGFPHSTPLYSALNTLCQPIISAGFNIGDVQITNDSSLNDIL